MADPPRKPEYHKVMVIRRLTSLDVQVWKTIRLEALRLHPEAFGSSFEEQSQLQDSEFEKRLNTNGMFGAFDDNSLVGCAGFFREDGLKVRHRGILISMYVKKEYRGSGLADRLVETVLEYAQSLGVVQVHLAVVTNNVGAKRLYERHGFVVYGEEPRSLKVDGIYYDEYLMVNKLD